MMLSEVMEAALLFIPKTAERRNFILELGVTDSDPLLLGGLSFTSSSVQAPQILIHVFGQFLHSVIPFLSTNIRIILPINKFLSEKKKLLFCVY
jgi:hypothetical protein